MFSKKKDNGYKQLLEGVRIKSLIYGEKTHMVEFNLDKGGVFPKHSHPHEQIGYLVSGRINLTVGDETLEAGPGDSWCIPGDAEHWAEVLEPSVIVEVFSPVREDYLN